MKHIEPNTFNLVSGMTVICTGNNNMEFQISKVTDKNVSYYVGHEYKGGTGKNTLKMATVSLRRFNEGIVSGWYIIKTTK